MSIVKFDYQKNSITFEAGNGSVMMNATEMAKQFSKKPIHWLKLPSTISFINALIEVRKSHYANLVVTKQGGIVAMQGTWLHEDVALEFARWLSPAFAIWCNDRIKELLRHGATATNPDDLLNPDFIIGLANQLKKERAEKDKLQQTAERLKNTADMLMKTTDLQADQLRIAAPKVIYCDTVLNSGSPIPTSVIAQELGFSSAVIFNKFLNTWGVIYKVRNTWILYNAHAKKGYTVNITTPYKDSHGENKTAIHMYWTEAGRQFLHAYVKNIRKKMNM